MTTEPQIVFEDGATEEEKQNAKMQVALAMVRGHDSVRELTLRGKIAVGFFLVLVLAYCVGGCWLSNNVLNKSDSSPATAVEQPQ